MTDAPLELNASAPPSVTFFESFGIAAAAMANWAARLAGDDWIREDDRDALVSDLRGAVAVLAGDITAADADGGMTPLQAAQASVARVLRQHKDLPVEDVDTLALRIARVVLDPGAPVGAVVAGRIGGYAEGVRAAVQYALEFVEPEGIGAAATERLYNGLRAMERRSHDAAERARA